jgi:hypothetical protein
MVRCVQLVDSDTRIGFFNTMADAQKSPATMALRSKRGADLIVASIQFEHLPHVESLRESTRAIGLEQSYAGSMWIACVLR